ncbi:MAG: extracellular solute-binding protein [Propionibacteriaceae bacterium]|jgi:arabinogalactan oligomer/maltooligosaccharide transport system substrate-binding protein|nr:extracellular solute-binding protein [Propionibacteriaceae bacterium]
MRKVIATIGVAVMGLAALTGCGGSDDADAGDATAMTLTVWAPAEDQVDSTSWLPKVEADFEAAHPEYKITWKNSIVSEGDAATQVKKDPAAAGDVFLYANDQLGALIQANAVGLLPPAAQEQVKSQNSDVLVTSVTGEDGQLYGVPFTGNTWFMYYNKSTFTEDDVKSLDAMLAKGKVSFPIKDAWYVPSFYVGNGCTLFGADGTDESAGVDFAGAKASDVTAYLAALVKNPNFVVDDQQSGLSGFQTGTVDAVFSGTWSAEQAKEYLGDDYAAAVPPTFTLNGAEVQITAFAGSKAAGFNPNSANAKAAAEFAAFLGSKQAQLDHFTLRGIVPSDESLASDAAITADPAAAAQIATVAGASVFQPTVAKMNNFWDPTETFGKALVSGDVTADNAAEKTEAWNAALNA